jgi:uncharacterized protein YndB with AHSA1/START domain
MTRTFDAPRELVFRAWTDCDLFQRWWGPRDFTAPFCRIDARPGGLLHYSMRSPQGDEFWGRGVYREVVPPERLTYMDGFADEHGELIPPEAYGMSPDWPAETLVEVTFAESGAGTTLTLRSDIPQSFAEEQGAMEGWSQSLDRLAALLRQDAHGLRQTA